MKYIYNILVLLFLGLTASCESESEQPDIEGLAENVLMEATVKELHISRSTGDGICDKAFNLTFQSSSGYEVGKVDFNSAGRGYTIRYDSEGVPFDLVWGDVVPDQPNGSTYSFYVDNLPEEMGRSIVVDFPENRDENPYSIGIYDGDFGSRDLIWGSAEQVIRKNIEDIDLYHVMSRFSLHVDLNNSSVGHEISLVSAEITNIFTSPLSFNRLSGNFELRKYENGEPWPEEKFIMVEDEDKWLEVKDENEVAYYSTPDFILPPQEFVQNNRPRLYVKVRSGDGTEKVFSSVLPTTMTVKDEAGVQKLWSMSFLRGTKLILSVRLNNEVGSLEFLPVSLIGWKEHKGDKTFTGYQASVSKTEDLDDLVNAYNNESIDKFYQWGYLADKDTNKWVFNVFNNLEIDYEFYKNKMGEREGLPYSFNIYEATITVLMPGDKKVYLSGAEGAEKLKKILSNGLSPDATMQDDKISGSSGNS